MKLQSALAIYLLFWTLTLFAVLPFGVRTADEDGSEPVPGQASSAPTNPMIGKKLLWTTLISGVLFGLFMANYEYGWIGVDDVPFWRTRGPYAPGLGSPQLSHGYLSESYAGNDTIAVRLRHFASSV